MGVDVPMLVGVVALVVEGLVVVDVPVLFVLVADALVVVVARMLPDVALRLVVVTWTTSKSIHCLKLMTCENFRPRCGCEYASHMKVIRRVARH